ncbi:hypothetical protein [Streptomyces sp. YIM 98790]|nr:hypothetical protein [Streptomyces sp. YIM 98790]
MWPALGWALTAAAGLLALAAVERTAVAPVLATTVFILLLAAGVAAVLP